MDCFLAVESDYDGPHLDAEGRVTKDFMFELLPYFENQKKLHKKYAYQVRIIGEKKKTNFFFHLDYSTNFNIPQNNTEFSRCDCTSGKNGY